jgi:SAM-dependent methyltransferase
VSGVFRGGGEAYDSFMGRYSARLAPLFADFFEAHGRVLDLGAGTGMLTRELLARGCEVVAAEPSPEFCAALRERFPSIDVVQTPAEELPFEAGTFDAAAAQLVVAFMAEASRGVAEMARVARTVAVCMWGIQEHELFAAIERTANAIGADRLAEPRRYRTPEELRDLLVPLGGVEQAELDVTASYTGFDDFWHTLELQIGPAGSWLHALDDEQRERARDEMVRQLGSPSGAFELTGRCYAAKVTRA